MFFNFFIVESGKYIYVKKNIKYKKKTKRKIYIAENNINK